MRQNGAAFDVQSLWAVQDMAQGVGGFVGDLHLFLTQEEPSLEQKFKFVAVQESVGKTQELLELHVAPATPPHLDT